MRLQWECLNAVSSQAVSQKLCQKMQNMAEQSVIIHKYVQGQNTLLLLFIWLCWEQYLTIKFTSSTCIFKELPSLSFTQQLSIWSRTRTTSSVATLLLLLCNFLEWFHWGVHRKKKKMDFTEYELCCYSAVEKTCPGRLRSLIQDNIRIFTAERFCLLIQHPFSY